MSKRVGRKKNNKPRDEIHKMETNKQNYKDSMIQRIGSFSKSLRLINP